MAIQYISQVLANFSAKRDAALVRKLADAIRTSVLYGSAVYDAASLIDAAGATGTITVTGAALGDLANVSFGVDLQGITCTSYVSAANTVSFRLQNESGGTIDLASTTVRAVVMKASAFNATTGFNLLA